MLVTEDNDVEEEEEEEEELESGSMLPEMFPFPLKLISIVIDRRQA